ncbi:hypothetical protein WR25_00554 [Diploscapter pachys]|uniref:DUF7808 domain-containing protein n=1 Tax=Diploscapter pachys TaxID=2018661 RepID=A0A2A2JJY6_9BILA|nr:hypothetical protein WR25_00554 [Diploscapter pachys]
MFVLFIVGTLFICTLTNAQENNTRGENIWNRWEKRTVDCISSGKKDDCVLIAEKANPPLDTTKFKCHREPMPQNDWNPLARNSTTRLLCPIGCKPGFDLSVLTKVPHDNAKCQKYYTYGKLRNEKENEWYLWMTEPCEFVALTTHCRFHDVKDGKIADEIRVH